MDMLPESVTSFASYFEDCDCYSLTVRRDETDSFDIELSRMGEVEGDLTLSDVLPVVPVGSMWSQALGWHSYVGVPFETRSGYWLALGVEAVLPHRTRGAYPCFQAFIFPFTTRLRRALQRLKAFTQAISTGEDQVALRVPDRDPGVIQSNATDPAGHRHAEILILRSAMRHYLRKDLVWFRTLIISEDTIRNFRYPSKWRSHSSSRHVPRVVFASYLLGSNPAVDGGFSSKYRKWAHSNRGGRGSEGLPEAQASGCLWRFLP